LEDTVAAFGLQAACTPEGGGRAKLFVLNREEPNFPSLDQVSEAFAASEGEGDLSLAHWRDVHRAYYQKQCAAWGIDWREDLPVVCENFELSHRG